jgi:hypothetical protein
MFRRSISVFLGKGLKEHFLNSYVSVRKAKYAVSRETRCPRAYGLKGPALDGISNSTHTHTHASALDGGGWSAPQPGRLAPGKDAVPIVQEAGWASKPAWISAENLAPHRDSISGPSIP